jgi:hypothetical protein
VEDHPRARQQHAVVRDEEAVHVEERQRVQQHVVRREAPGLDEREPVRREVAVREHRALRAARRAGRVDDHGEVVAARIGNRVHGRFRRSGVRERAVAGGIERQDRADLRLARARIERRAAFRPAHEHGRLGVTEEVRDLGGLIRGVERQVDEAAAQTREIQRERRGTLLDLRRDAVAGFRAGTRERMRDARGQCGHLAVADGGAVLLFEQDGGGIARCAVFDEGEEVFVGHGGGKLGAGHSPKPGERVQRSMTRDSKSADSDGRPSARAPMTSSTARAGNVWSRNPGQPVTVVAAAASAT